MSEIKQDVPRAEQGIIYAPWERTFTRVLTPFEEFIHRQTTSGLLLMGTAIIALVLANSFVAEAYLHFIHTPTSINIGTWGISMSLHHFVNDGLMALFFFVVGIMLFNDGISKLHHLHTDDFESFSFKAVDDFSNQISLESVGLYDNKRSFFFWVRHGNVCSIGYGV